MNCAHILLTLILLHISHQALGQATVATAAPPISEPPRVLSSNSRVVFEVPIFAWGGKVNCDASGNLYFNVSEYNPLALHEAGPYLKIDADGRRHQLFSPYVQAKQDGTTPQAIDATDGVSPDGTFYILLHNSGGNELQRFKGDGSYVGSTRLDLPSGLTITHWAIQNNEIVYVSGYFESSASDTRPSNGFAAVIAPGWKVIANLSETSIPFHIEEGSPQIPEGDVTAATDGRFYILGAKQIFVVTQSGQIENTFPVTKPNPDARAVRIDVSGGMISVLFYTLMAGKSAPPFPKASAVLLNSQTGEPIHTIQFADSLTNTVLCFQSKEGYSLMAVDKKMAADDIVPIR